MSISRSADGRIGGIEATLDPSKVRFGTGSLDAIEDVKGFVGGLLPRFARDKALADGRTLVTDADVMASIPAALAAVSDDFKE